MENQNGKNYKESSNMICVLCAKEILPDDEQDSFKIPEGAPPPTPPGSHSIHHGCMLNSLVIAQRLGDIERIKAEIKESERRTGWIAANKFDCLKCGYEN